MPDPAVVPNWRTWPSDTSRSGVHAVFIAALCHCQWMLSRALKGEWRWSSGDNDDPVTPQLLKLDAIPILSATECDGRRERSSTCQPRQLSWWQILNSRLTIARYPSTPDRRKLTCRDFAIPSPLIPFASEFISDCVPPDLPYFFLPSISPFPLSHSKTSRTQLDRSKAFASAESQLTLLHFHHRANRNSFAPSISSHMANHTCEHRRPPRTTTLI